MSVSQPTSIAQGSAKNQTAMQKKLYFTFLLAGICYWTEASPVNLGTLEFDNLDTDLDDLKYEVEEEDLDDFSKLLDGVDANKSVESEQDKSKVNINTSGFKKKTAANKGLTSKYNIEDLKKFFKGVGVKDQGAFSDDKLYAAINALAAEAVGAKGTEERKFKKGTKTRGFHKVHHKDEYKKDKEFYEDDETTGSIKKVGGKTLGYKIGGGAGFNKEHFRRDHSKGIYGKEGYLDNGFLDKQYSGYSDAQGFDGSFKNSDY